MTRKSYNKPRIQVSLPDDIKVIYENTASIIGIPASKLIAKILTESAPAIVDIGAALEQVKIDPVKGLKGLTDAIQTSRVDSYDAQADLEQEISRQKKLQKTKKGKK